MQHWARGMKPDKSVIKVQGLVTRERADKSKRMRIERRMMTDKPTDCLVNSVQPVLDTNSFAFAGHAPCTR